VINLDLAEAHDLIRRAARGDLEAQQLFQSAFTPSEECVSCDRPVGYGGGALTYWPDPANRGQATVGLDCAACAASPERTVRKRAMLKMMFGHKVTIRKDEQVGYMRGGRLKRSKGRGT